MRLTSSGFVTTTSRVNPLLRTNIRPISHSIQSNPFHRPPSSISPFDYPPAMPQSRTAMSSSTNSIPEFITSVGPVKAVGSFVGVFSLLALIKYRNAIQRRIRQVRQESWIFGAGVTMERIVEDDKSSPKTGSGVFRNLKLMEMDPEFEAKCKKDGHPVTALSTYMGQLRPKGLPKRMSVEDTPRIIQREIEAGLAAGLLKALGPNLGRALLPAVGTGLIQRKAKGLAGNIATKWILSEEGISESNDKGGIPIELMTLLAAADINAKVNSGKEPTFKDESVVTMNLSAMDKLKSGEVVKGPTFCNGPADTALIPNDFIVSKHFDSAIEGMEEILSGHDDKGELTSTEMKMAQDEAIKYEQEHEDALAYKKAQRKDSEHVYDPDDRSLGEPVPVNPRLFPGLHLGVANALNSHTKREVIRMRLISILLNKLGANYHRQVNGETEELFQLRMNEGDKPITKPSELVQALIDSGHTVEVVPTSRMTTFGLNFCLKEPDGSWSNIPVGIFLETGYEDRKGNMAPAMMPHSGVDMYIKGPLAGKRGDGTPSELRLQHFIGIEGFAGWHPHSAPEVPFNEAVERGARLCGDDAVRAARICALYANVLNGLGTERELPYGGYGTQAVCNDSAALVQQCLYGVNTIYPMVSIGKYMMRTMRFAQRFQEDMSEKLPGEMDPEIEELGNIIHAMKKIPSDLNASPANAHSAATRLISTLQPKMPLRLMKDAKKVMQSILNEETMEEVEQPEHAEKDKVKAVETREMVANGSSR